MSGYTAMLRTRRNFLSASIAVLTVTKAAAQRRPLAPPPTPRRIGIVSTITFDLEFRACFLAGLADNNGWQLASPTKPIAFPTPFGGHNPGEADGKYGGTHGHTVLRKLINDHTQGQGGIHLIVAAGGLTTQAAAFEELQGGLIPFVYLAGHFPPSLPLPLPAGAKAPPPGLYCGVVLNISELHAGAADALAKKGATKAGIWLVENGNSDMAALECSDWQRDVNNNCFFFFNDPKIDNPDPSTARSTYLNEVLKLKAQNPTPTGVVVSSDPYFRTTAPDFAFAMTTLMPGVPVCYPFADFSPSGSNILLTNAPVLSTPTATDANNAYFQLGKRAADVLNNSTDATPMPASKLTSKMWDGSKWVDA